MMRILLPSGCVSGFGASTPKEIVCDMSLALLSAIAKSFTRHNNITSYINMCYNILFHKFSPVEELYIRCDVAHVIKAFTRLTSLRQERTRTRKFFIRTLAKLLLCTDIAIAKDIRLSIFIVAQSETDGYENGTPTNCETRKRQLATLIADGHETTDEQIILDLIEQRNACNINESTENDKEYFCNIEDSLFKNMAVGLYEESKSLVSNNGDHDNLQHVPDLCLEIINYCKLLPLWSAIMCPYFASSGNISSSAPVESNINDIKHRVFKNVDLPTRIDEFVLIHIDILQGTMILVEAANKQAENKDVSEKSKEEDIITQKPNTQPSVAPPVDSLLIDEKENSEGIFFNPSNLKTNAQQISQKKTVRFEETVVSISLLEEEENAVENWRGEGVTKPKRLRRSYLENQKEWKHIDLSCQTRVLPICLLKNGSGSTLKPVVIDNKNFIFTNTCGFDSLMQIMTAAYCDVKHFMHNLSKNELYTICEKLVLGKISKLVYYLRGKILSTIFANKENQCNIFVVNSVCTIKDLLHKLMEHFYIDWTRSDQSTCFNCNYYETHQYSCLTFTEDNFYLGIEVSLKNNNYFCPRCEEKTLVNRPSFNKKFMCIEWLTKDGLDRKLNLQNLPTGFKMNLENGVTAKFVLKGAVEIQAPANPTQTSMVGHYIALCRRLHGKWEICNDLHDKIKGHIMMEKEFTCAMLFYARES